VRAGLLLSFWAFFAQAQVVGPLPPETQAPAPTNPDAVDTAELERERAFLIESLSLSDSENLNQLRARAPSDVMKVLDTVRAQYDGPQGSSALATRIREAASRASKERKPQLRVRASDPGIMIVMRDSARARLRVEQALFDKSLSDTLKLALLRAYIRDVYMPMRGLVYSLAREDSVSDGSFTDSLMNDDNLKAFLDNISLNIPKDLVSTRARREALDSLDPLGIRGRSPLDRFGIDWLDMASHGPACKQQDRLRVDPLAALSNDLRNIVTVVRDPKDPNKATATHDDYLRGMKMMSAHMLINQIQIYNLMSGQEHRPVDVPVACRKIANGGLPDRLPALEYPPGFRDQFLGNLFSNAGVVAGTPQYEAHYREYVRADPNMGGFHGLLPFQRLRAAQRGLDPKRPQNEEPAISDTEDFDTVLALIAPDALKAQASYEKQYRRYDSRQGRYTGPQYPGVSVAESILSRSDKLPEGLRRIPANDAAKRVVATLHMAGSDPLPNETVEIVRLDPTTRKPTGEDLGKHLKEDEQNAQWHHVEDRPLSVYLLRKMQEAGAMSWQDVIPAPLRARLEAQKQNISLPSWDSPDSYKRWALYEIGTFAKEVMDMPPGEERKRYIGLLPCPATFCNRGNYSDFWTGRERFLKYLHNLTKRHTSEYYYTPLTPFEDRELRKLWSSEIPQLWSRLQRPLAGSGEPIWPNLVTTEWQFLSSQIETNPWASVQLSLYLEEYLTGPDRPQRQGFHPVAQVMLGGLRGSLRLDRYRGQLQPFHGNRALSDKQKRQLWTEVVEQEAAGNQRVFVPERLAARGETIYDAIERVANRTVLSRDAAEAAARSVMGPSRVPVSMEYVDEFLKTPEAQVASRLHQLYEAQGDETRQREIFDSLTQEFGVARVGDAKTQFLALDSALKRPLLNQLTAEGASIQKTAAVQLLHDLCNTPLTDKEGFKRVFHSTIKNQDRLNQLLGLPGLPPEIDDFLNEGMWTSPEMMTTYAQLAFLIGATVLSAGCTVATGGLCAPVLAAVLATAATGTGIVLFDQTLDRKARSDERDNFVKAFNAMGFNTDEDAANSRDDSVFGKRVGYTWAVLDAAFMLPFVGITGKAVQTGTRSASVTLSAVRSGIAQRGLAATADDAWRVLNHPLQKLGSNHPWTRLTQGWKSMRGDMVQAARETELVYARATLGVSDHSFRLFGIAGPRVSTEFAIRSIDTATAEVNRAFAKRVAGHFGGDPKRFRSFFSRYLGYYDSKIQKFQSVVGAPNSAESMSRFRRVLEATRIPQKLRERLLKKATQGDQLKKFLTQLDQLEAGRPLDDFIAEHGDLLEEIIIHLPFRWRELPYHVAFGGSPWNGRLVLGGTVDGVALKKFATSREILGFHAARQEALVRLGIEEFTVRNDSWNLFNGVMDRMRGDSDLWNRNAFSVLDFESDVAQAIYTHHVTKAGSPGAKILQGLGVQSANDLKQLLFSGADDSQRVLLQALWEMTPGEEIFKLPKVAEFADQAAKRLANYNNTDEFEDYLSALKVLSLGKQPRAFNQ
jgi:hypothetical protein